MIFDTSATPLLKQFHHAKEVEAVAIKQLLSAMESGLRDEVVLSELIKNMEKTTNASADIWTKLQAVALDK